MSATGPGSRQARSGPLAGLRIAVTRPLDQARALIEPLEAAGATTRCFPLIRIAGPVDPADLRTAADRLPAFDWVVFTSANAVAALAAAAPGGRLPADPPPRLAAVGPATAAACERAGRSADLISPSSNAEGLADALAATAPLQGAHVLWPRARGARPLLGDLLVAAGARVDAPEAYRSVPDRDGASRLVRAVARGAIDLLTFTSPSAVRSFSEAGGVIPPGVRVATIGPVTAAAAGEAGLAVHIAPDDASAAHLTEAIVRAFGNRPDGAT